MQRQIAFNPATESELAAAVARLTAAETALDKYTNDAQDQWSLILSAERIMRALNRAQSVNLYDFKPADLAIIETHHPDIAARLPPNGSPFSYDYRPIQMEFEQFESEMSSRNINYFNIAHIKLWQGICVAQDEVDRVRAAAQATTIHDLPNEILVAILSHVPNRQAASRTCELLGEIAATM